ncbi:MAG TPA: GvpL/GvpF family gas vesicle protein [Methylomirabilota bacterium]|nr:GvpL/GvpF family gas vesicle protein [Methylomirabilota bacterium]
MTPGRRSATYLYCLVEADRRPSLARAPRGVPGAAEPRILPAAAGLWLVVADAPLALYGSGPIERGLRDLEWVAVRGAAHARVVEHFARRLTTVPMKLFTLFTTDERAVAHVRGAEAQVRRVLGRVAGRREWGVRVRLDVALARRRAGRRRPPAPAPRREGTRFLLAKKHERDVTREVVREGRVAVEDAFAALAGLADATRRRSTTELDGTRVVLDAALLVDARRTVGFRRAARRTAAALATRGYRLSLTGPWPAYNFVSDGR